MKNKTKIKVGIIGLGNCAKSLVEGVSYYQQKEGTDGIMNPNIGGYLPGDIEIAIAFEIDSRKVGKPIGDAIYELPNCAINLHKVDGDEFPGKVFRTEILDGYAPHLDNYPAETRFLKDNGARTLTRKQIIEKIKDLKVDMLINYLPVGSQKATEYWALICIEAGVSLVNCIPVFIASDPVWEQKFIDAGIPLIGDDMRSEFGASILSQVFQELAFSRGHKVKAHIQRNVGGNTDFLNMEDSTRLASKKISKENVIRAQNEIRGIGTEDSFLHAGPSEYIKYYGDNKVANFRLELEGFMGSPVILDAQLSVQDSPNSAGVVIDAVRYLKVAREMGIVGSLRGPSAFTQKTPPQQMMLVDAIKECDELASRRFTKSTKRNVICK
jgi:myo-inositol-1-phosphate synthase